MLRRILSFLRTWQTGQALLFFIIITGFMIYPLFLNFSDKFVAGGDVYEYVWKLWWFKHTLLESGQSPWIVPDIYYPTGYLLAYGEATPANTVLALPLSWLWGEIPTYNALIFISTVLSGFTMFLLAREVTGNFWAGLLAGIIFAFSPFRRLQLIHLNIVTTQWLPLIFYFLERLARTNRRIYGLAAGVAFALNALATWYYALAGALFVLIWGLVRFRPIKSYLRQKRFWQAIALFGFAALILILPFVWPYLAILGDPDTSIPIENSNYYSASPIDYLLPSPFQFLWGQWVFQNLLVHQPDPGEFILGWGFVALLFGLYGWRFASPEAKHPWLVVILVAVILSFGLTLHIVGRQIVIPAPKPVVETFNQTLDNISQHYSLNPEIFTLSRADGLIIPMPALLLRWFAPAIGKVRTWTRFGLIALFGVSILAALGATAWYRREIIPKSYSPSKQRLAWLIVISLALFELWWAPLQMVTPQLARPVDRWLADQPEEFAIIQYPLDSAFRAEQFTYTWTHGKPIVHGFTAAYFSFAFSRRHPELLHFPNPAALKQLSDWSVRYVLIETEKTSNSEGETLLEATANTPCLKPATIQGSIHVFELVNCNSAAGID